MEIYKENIYFSNWGQIYIGIKREWLTVDEAIDIFNKSKILYSKEHDILIYEAIQESHFKVLEVIKKIIRESGYPPIENVEEDIVKKGTFKRFNYNYWDIWEIELLLRIKNKNLSKEDTLYCIHLLYFDYNDIFNWYSFNPLYLLGDRIPRSTDILFDNFEKYFELKLSLLRLNNQYF
jgi:hypothetical protein